MQEARVVLPSSIRNLNNEEKRKYILDHINGKVSQEIALKYFVEKECQIDIAIDLGVCSKTIYNKLVKIKKELE